MRDGTRVSPRHPWSLLLTGLAPIGVLTAASWVGTLTAPTLAATSPLALAALSPRLPFLAVAAAAAPLPAFMAVGLIRLVAADPAHYMMGREGREWASHRIGRRSLLGHPVVDRLRQAVEGQWLVVVALRPTGIVLCAAGAAGLRARAVAVADIVGTAGYLGVVWLAGRMASPHLLDTAVAATRAVAVAITGAAVCAGVHRALHVRSGRRLAACRRAHPSAVRRGPDVSPLHHGAAE